MSHRHLPLLAVLLTVSAAAAQSLTTYVDPRIGTGDHGHVFLGANVPFGMVNAGPTQIESGWDWCSGYHESGTKVVGFAQTHLSGTGCSDLGDVAIMPAVKELGLSRQGLATTFAHEQEEVRPGYYSIVLPESGIRTEITATRRTAMYRITYPEGAHRHLYVDLENGIDDALLSGRLQQIDPYTYVGYRISHGWANQQHCYFAMRLSQKSRIYEQATVKSKRADGPAPIYHLQVTTSSEPLLVNIALSPVSEANAIANLKAEAYKGGRLIDFDTVCAAADAAWNRELGRITATFQNDRDRRIFYTSMYHFMVAPQTWDDVNGDWRGADNRVYRSMASTVPELCSIVIEGRDEATKKPTPESPVGTSKYLTTLSLWDTYRAAAPLSTIILPEMMPAVAETYLRIYREQGKLPVWHLMSQETNCMVGCPAVPILADLLLKGYVSDTLTAWKAMYSSLTMDERGLDDMKRLGYVASDHHGGALSMSLEYMLADGAAAQAGTAIIAASSPSAAAPVNPSTPPAVSELGGSAAEMRPQVEYLARRSRLYSHLYDPRVGYLRPRNSQGEFPATDAFNPANQTAGYTEGNPWQYLWLVPHDVQGLADMLGGRERALARLDSLFAADSRLNDDANPDITGLIGQYAHGNEPSHHIAYLYALLGQPRKGAAIIKRIQRELYTDQPAGLCGNEDVGQMSAWYILSALGFYQVEPCGGRYVVGSPLVEQATLHVGGGRTFTIRTHGLTDKAIHVRRATLNGRPLVPTDGALIVRHADIAAGGTLDLYMSR
ncbi:MAG: glycoside hydrolase family 92 protein [Bacteroidaceae bacterium]|nr:glycoside hydrolase family 92 protein [Bacteroidaceae bacterium]